MIELCVNYHNRWCFYRPEHRFPQCGETHLYDFNVRGETYRVHIAGCNFPAKDGIWSPGVAAASEVEKASGVELEQGKLMQQRIEQHFWTPYNTHLRHFDRREFVEAKQPSRGSSGWYDVQATIQQMGGGSVCQLCGETGNGWWKRLCAGGEYVNEPLCDECGHQLQDAWDEKFKKNCDACGRRYLPDEHRFSRVKGNACSQQCREKLNTQSAIRSRFRRERESVARELNQILSMESK